MRDRQEIDRDRYRDKDRATEIEAQVEGGLELSSITRSSVKDPKGNATRSLVKKAGSYIFSQPLAMLRQQAGPESQ